MRSAARGLPPKARGGFSEGSENPFGIGVHEDFLKAEIHRAAKSEAEPRSPQGGRLASTQVSGPCGEREQGTGASK
jgi:hypothetical protein